MAASTELSVDSTIDLKASGRAPATTWSAPRRRVRLGSIPWPVVPFLLFCLLLEIIPLTILVRDSFRELGIGNLTLQNYAAVAEPLYWHSLRNSILLSAGTAVLGAIWGALAAAAIV